MFKSFVHFFFYLQLSITLAKLAIEFLGRSGLSLRTQESYEFTLLPFLAQYGRFPIDTITRQEVLAYLGSSRDTCKIVQDDPQSLIHKALQALRSKKFEY